MSRKLGKAGLEETMQGPYGLKYVAFYSPEDVIVSPLHVIFQLPLDDSGKRLINVMDGANLTLVAAIHEPVQGSSLMDAAQWLLDIASARYDCDARPLDAWI